MPGDYSRNTFDPKKHYVGVLMQQGRVQIDADWNEQLSIRQHDVETKTRDIIGKSGAPLDGGGFALQVIKEGSDLRIMPGRIYVDGILCELQTCSVPVALVPGNTNQLQLPSIEVDGYPLAAGEWIELFDGGALQSSPLMAPLLLRISSVKAEDARIAIEGAPSDFVASPPHKLWLRRVITFFTQPDYPNPGIDGVQGSPPAELSSPPGHPCLPPGQYLAFLDVWRHEVTALDDPRIREVALGGPDTGTRLKTIGQVRLLEVTLTSPPDFDCTAEFPEWDDLVKPSDGRMNARTLPASPNENPCQLPPTAGYRRLENQLYRVQICDGGNRGEATFKWSRDNASVETCIVEIDATDGTQVTVSSTGKDEVLGFKPGQWVEIIDAETELRSKPYPLVQIDEVSPEQNLITLTTDISAHRSTARKLRRWDTADSKAVNEAGLIHLTAGDAKNEGWIELEGGIQVHFEEGLYHSGDYWLIPARTFTGEIEWPPFETPNTHPIPQAPCGIHHHYCRLGFVDTTGTPPAVHDCRCRFPSLNQTQGLYYVSGEGQEVMPVPPNPFATLPQPLVVGVVNPQCRPYPAKVRYAIMTGTGRLRSSDDGNVGTRIDLLADERGVVECHWDLGADPEAAGNLPSQQVEAQLLDEHDQPIHLPIRFNANLSIASQVAYVPPDPCDLLADQHTVQDALNRLAGAVSLYPIVPQHWEWSGRPPSREVEVKVLAANRCGPVNGASIRFAVVAGGGVVDPSTATTLEDGCVSRFWKLGWKPGLQVLQATLKEGEGDELRPPPPWAPPTTVFFTAICSEPAIRVRQVQVGSNQNELLNDNEVTIDDFVNGLHVLCQADPFEPKDPIVSAGNLDAVSVNRATVSVTLELPLLESGPLSVIGASREVNGDIAVKFSKPIALPATDTELFRLLNASGGVAGTVVRAVLEDDDQTVRLNVKMLELDVNCLVYVQNITAADDPNETIQSQRALASLHYSEASTPDKFALLSATPTAPNVVRLQFSQQADTNALQNKNNYEVLSGVKVNAATPPADGNGMVVDLTLSALEPNRAYHVRVSGTLPAVNQQYGALDTSRAFASFYIGDTDALVGFHPVILAAQVSVEKRIIAYQPTADCGSWLLSTVSSLLACTPDRRILSRLTLKGNFIWDAKNPDLFLDGDTFGQPRQDKWTSLRLESGSGDGRRGGDFEMWFWLVGKKTITPPTISAIADKTTTIGTTVNLSFTVNSQFAPAEYLVVVARSSEQSVVPNSSLYLAMNPSNPDQRRLVITPVQKGDTDITLTVTDPNGASAGTRFHLTVTQSKTITKSENEDKAATAEVGVPKIPVPPISPVDPGTPVGPIGPDSPTGPQPRHVQSSTRKQPRRKRKTSPQGRAFIPREERPDTSTPDKPN